MYVCYVITSEPLHWSDKKKQITPLKFFEFRGCFRLTRTSHGLVCSFASGKKNTDSMEHYQISSLLAINFFL